MSKDFISNECSHDTVAIFCGECLSSVVCENLLKIIPEPSTDNKENLHIHSPEFLRNT